ncbi:MAG: hypothetical protein IPJ07_10845 [Acidobacteria bacterium]|nr:hypothetical protein [Acidobacteriota bacterium]
MLKVLVVGCLFQNNGGPRIIWLSSERYQSREAGWMNITRRRSSGRQSFLHPVVPDFRRARGLSQYHRRKPTIAPDLGLIFSNAGFYFGTSYFLLENKYQFLSRIIRDRRVCFYLGLSVIDEIHARPRRQVPDYDLYRSGGELPDAGRTDTAWDQHWVTMSWALEGLVPMWIGLEIAQPAVESRFRDYLFSISVLSLADVRSGGIEFWIQPVVQSERQQTRVIGGDTGAGSLVIAAILYQNSKSKLSCASGSSSVGLIVVANLVTLIWLEFGCHRSIQ